jgi:hypothetical protein
MAENLSLQDRSASETPLQKGDGRGYWKFWMGMEKVFFRRSMNACDSRVENLK